MVDAFAQVGSAARREVQRRALDAVQELVAAERWREAGAALTDIDVPGGPLAAQREALAAEIGQGLAAEVAVERCKTLQTSGNLLEAAVVFGKLVHVQALAVAEALRPKVEQLAATWPRAALHLVELDCALDRFDAALTGWKAIDKTTLVADEARHHLHLRGYLAIMQGDLNDGIERLDLALATEPEITCGCMVKYWRDVAAAMCGRATGIAEQPLSELLGAVASSESAIEEGRCVEVRATLAKYGLDGEPNVQSAARFALAWLRDPAERTADDRFQEAVALAVFLAVVDRTGRAHRDHLLLPGHHWPRARIEALAAEAAVRHAEIVAGFFGAR
jgi:hypothetical protein